jgi:hypothetical protein
MRLINGHPETEPDSRSSNIEVSGRWTLAIHEATF